MKKLFDLENEEGSTAEPMDMGVIATISNEDLAISIEQGYQEVDKTFGVMDDAMVHVGTLERSIAIEEKALETDVSVGTVQLAMESLTSTGTLLGLPTASYEVSTESISENTVTALEISIEEKKNIVTKVLDFIKSMYAKVKAAILKVVNKVFMAIDNLGPKAEALLKVLEGKESTLLKDDAGKLSDSEVKEIGNKFGVLSQSAGGFKSGFSKDMISYVNDISDKGNAPLEALIVGKGNINAIIDNFSNVKLNTALAGAGKKLFGKDFEKSDNKDAKLNTLVISADGINAKCIQATVVNVEKEFFSKPLPTVRLTFKTYTLKDDKVKGLKVELLGLSELEDLATSTKKLAGVRKAWQKGIETSYEGVNKLIENSIEKDIKTAVDDIMKDYAGTLAKDDSKYEIAKKVITKVITDNYTDVANVGPKALAEITKAYYTGIKNNLSVAAIMASKYKASK